MPTDLATVTETLADRDDPRLSADFWRAIPGREGNHPTIVVGVVHDHPASSHRVAEVAREFDPVTLALELPPLAVPAFTRAADGERECAGGEMSAAIAARPSASVVGIDGLDRQFLSRFVTTAVQTRASLHTARQALGELGEMAGHALRCRLGRTPAVGGEHAVSTTHPPGQQASDERTQVARSRSLLGAIERTEASLLVDGIREQAMAGRLDTLREDGSVLAVVGMNHLDAVATAIDPDAAD